MRRRLPARMGAGLLTLVATLGLTLSSLAQAASVDNAVAHLTARRAQFRTVAELEDTKLGLVTSLMSSSPTFQFSSIRPGAVFNLTIYRKSCNELNTDNQISRAKVGKQLNCF